MRRNPPPNGLRNAPTLLLPVSSVIDLLPNSSRLERIATYREAMRRGEDFPPISVVRFAGRFVVADGHKRLAALKSLGREQVLVELWSWRDWTADQRRQLRENLAKNRRILRLIFSNPKESWRLLRSTLRHWRRVALAIIHHVHPPGRQKRPD